MGVAAYLAQAFASPEIMNAMPEDQRMIIENRPAWATGAFAIATWGGFLGSFFLLLRKNLAYMLLVLSFLGVIVQMIYEVFMADTAVAYGPSEISMTVMIPLVALLLILLARKGKMVGWLK